MATKVRLTLEQFLEMMSTLLSTRKEKSRREVTISLTA